MFQFARLPRLSYGFRQAYARITTRGLPHSESPGSTVGQHLLRAYRSRPRPSSASGAKASTVCPSSLAPPPLPPRAKGVVAGGPRRAVPSQPCGPESLRGHCVALGAVLRTLPHLAFQPPRLTPPPAPAGVRFRGQRGGRGKGGGGGTRGEGWRKRRKDEEGKVTGGRSKQVTSEHWKRPKAGKKNPPA